MIDIVFLLLLGALIDRVTMMAWRKWRFSLRPVKVPQERIEQVLPHPAQVAREEYARWRQYWLANQARIQREHEE